MKGVWSIEKSMNDRKFKNLFRLIKNTFSVCVSYTHRHYSTVQSNYLLLLFHVCAGEEKTVSFLSCLSAFTLDTSDAASVAEDQTESIWIFHAKYFCHLNPLMSSTLTSTFCFNQVHCAFDCDIRAGKTFGWTEFKCKQTQATAPFSEYIETRLVVMYLSKVLF